MTNIRDGHGVVHLEHLAWHTRCGLDLQWQQPKEMFDLTELVEDHVTCLWCAGKRRKA